MIADEIDPRNVAEATKARALARRNAKALEVTWNDLRSKKWPWLATVPEHFIGKRAVHANEMLRAWGMDTTVELLTWVVEQWDTIRWEHERLGEQLEDVPTFGQVFAFRDTLATIWATEKARPVKTHQG